MNIGSIIKSLIRLAILVAMLGFLAIFILPASGVSGSILSFLPANLSSGPLIMLVIPFIIFIYLLKLVIDTVKDIINSF